ncbi:hypothetical protein FOZ60_000587 [Perkinsus olseni]|uniref:Fe2OG dioxygenase domain-containing protein n=1 Tax=Perkinsus olseni TaxID=32597 RepID=A0A7J6P483_PEROL|nr:hypothetical protein FOZ60_000587 [Perkinsus olseni]
MTNGLKEVVELGSSSEESDCSIEKLPPRKRSRKAEPPRPREGRVLNLPGDTPLDRWPLDDEGSWLTYLPSFVEDPAEALGELMREVPWGQGTVKIFGKEHLERRLTAFYADDGKQYRYSGGPLRVPSPWTRGPMVIAKLKKAVSKECDEQFNCCVLNYYRDGSDNIGMHSDDEKVLGKKPSIACISLGAERDFFLDAKKDKRKVHIVPRSGSLLVMGGSTQRLWKHGLPSRKREHRPRISLTFRYALRGAN